MFEIAAIQAGRVVDGDPYEVEVRLIDRLNRKLAWLSVESTDAPEE